jgi:hypothetical protein
MAAGLLTGIPDMMLSAVISTCRAHVVTPAHRDEWIKAALMHLAMHVGRPSVTCVCVEDL